MQLLNVTPLVAELGSAEISDSPLRAVVLHAKATYRFDLDGKLSLESDDPLPLFGSDEPTELGLLPRDNFPAWDPPFDVILLGRAHAPGGRPTAEMTVSLSVGDVRRQLVVSGDRQWLGEGSSARIGPATPFTSMPLTYANAFGGSTRVLIEENSGVGLSDTRNAEGKGWDPTPAIEALAESLKPRAGYPQWEKARQLPNLEHPEARIRSWQDDPGPACWATLSLQSALHAQRSVNQSKVGARLEHPMELFNNLIFRRAADGWLLPKKPAPHSPIVLEGLLRDRPRLALRLPSPSVFLDVD